MPSKKSQVVKSTTAVNRLKGQSESPINMNAAAEADEGIRVGAKGPQLVIPEENIFEEPNLGSEVELARTAQKEIRRPRKREWVVVNRSSEFQTKLLARERPGSFDEDYYYIDPQLRVDLVEMELRSYRVFSYYVVREQKFLLWPDSVNDSSWGKNMRSLFRKGDDWFETHKFRMIPSKKKGRHTVLAEELEGEFYSGIHWPDESVGEMLLDAIGADHFISDANHPIYKELVAGKELELDS